MFKNRQKIDPKVRFQRQNFQQKLDQARTYKRTGKTLPTSSGEAFLNKIGLGNIRNRLLLLAAALIAILIIYVPNFFYVKNIIVSGMEQQEAQQVRQEAQDYFKIKPLWPQRNLLLLSKGRLQAYLLSRDQSILEVKSIKKKFPNSLEIYLVPRTPQFVLQTATGTFVLSNDGKVSLQITSQDLQATGSPYSNLTSVFMTNPSESPAIGQNYLSPELINTLNDIMAKAPSVLNSPIKSFEMDTPTDLNLNVQMASGYKIILDTNSDLNTIWPRLSLLFSNISPQNQAKLFYVNMSIPDRAYVCYQGQPCTQPDKINVSTTTSSTLDSILTPTP